MAAQSGDPSAGGRAWTLAPWIVAVLLLLLPAVAMPFTDEVAWDAGDFALVGAMLFGACAILECAARRTRNGFYLVAVGVAVVAALLLTWMTLAVGIIGPESHPANMLYGGVLAVAIVGGLVARFRALGLARAFCATAFIQTMIGVVAMAAGWGSASAIAGLTAIFASLWIASAMLFRRAAHGEEP